MNFLLFFLSVAAFGLPVNQASHKTEVESLLSLNGPKEDIFALIKKLRADNAKVIKELAEEQALATTDVINKEGLKNVSVTAQTNALGAVEDKKRGLEDLLIKEKAAQVREAAARDAMDKARTNSAAANLTSATEGSRLDAEKKTCQQILSLLKELAGTASKEFLDEFRNNRRLLSIIDLSDLANADPKSIREVEEMVLQLITDGEKERQHYIKLAKEAKAVLDEKTTLHQDAERAYIAAAGLRKQCQDDLKVLEIEAATATKKANAAKKAWNDAKDHLVAVKARATKEGDRVAKEEKVFVEVTKLLNTLA